MPRRLICSLRTAALALVFIAAQAACDGEGPSGATANIAVNRVGAQSVTAPRGASASFPLAVERRGGYTGAVQFAAGNVPAGVSAAFSPASVSRDEQTTTLTLTVMPEAASGVFTITIRASGTNVAPQSTPVQLIVPPPSLALTAQPAVITVFEGSSTVIALAIERGDGFIGDVQLTVTGLPAAVQHVFSPATLAPGVNSSQLTVSPLNGAGPVAGVLVIRATSANGAVAVTNVNFFIGPPPRIVLSAGFGGLEVFSGRSATRVLTVRRENGFSGAVTLSFEDAPVGMTATFVPTVFTASETILTLTVNSAVTLGSYTPRIRARGEGVADAVVSLFVDVLPPP